MRKAMRNNRLLQILSHLGLGGIICITLLSIASGAIAGPRWLELASHFKVQYLLFSVLAFGIMLVAHRKRLSIIVSLFCLLVLVSNVFPWYIRPESAQIDSPSQAQVNSTHLKIINANIFVRNRNYGKTIAFVRAEKPDIAIFIEVNKSWVRKLEELKDILPYSSGLPSAYNLGITVFSRLPLENLDVNYFGSDEPNQFKKSSITADLNVNGQIVSLIATHPPTPIRPIVFNSRNQQLEAIAQYVQNLEHPVIVAGDFNITMWSPYYQKFIATSGLHNARQGFGILPTWPTNKAQDKFVSSISSLVGIPIDHCFVSSAIAVQNIRTGPNIDSDHLPLVTDLSIPSKSL